MDNFLFCLLPWFYVQAIPGNIRKAEHFVTFLKKVVVYFKGLLQV